MVSYSPWGHKESDTTEQLHFHFGKKKKKSFIIAVVILPTNDHLKFIRNNNFFKSSRSRDWKVRVEEYYYLINSLLASLDDRNFVVLTFEHTSSNKFWHLKHGK